MIRFNTTPETVPRKSEFIEVALTKPPESTETIRHNLGYVPRGAIIVRATEYFNFWYQKDDDPEWTAKEINMRFVATSPTPTNYRVLLEVF